MTKKKKINWKIWVNIFTVIALVGLVYALRDQIRATYENLTHINFWILLLMPVWQIINYYAYAKMYKHLLLFLKQDVRLKKLGEVQLELNFVNNVFPSGGVSGISYFGLRLRSFGVSAGAGTLVQVMKFGLVFISFQILLFAGLIMLAFGNKASNFLILISASLATFLFTATVLMFYLLSSRERLNSFFTWLSRGLNKVIHKIRPGNPETIDLNRVERLFGDLHENFMLIKNNLGVLKKPLLFALLANTTEVLTVYTVYVAFGQWVNPGAVIIAYAVANFAGTISVLPGGVGIYEALMTATLAAAGIPAALSLPVTVMYRILNMIIQLPPGYYFYQKALHAPQPVEPE